VTAPSLDPEPAPRTALNAPESAQDPVSGTERRPGGEFGPQTGAQSFGDEREATEATEPATITDPEWLRQQYAAAIQPLLMENLPKPIAAHRAREIAATVLFVRDRHLAQLRQRLELADATLGDAARLQRLRAQLAAEHAKAVAADQAAVQRPDHLRVTPHNGMAAGLEIAIFFADHHLREAGEEAGEQHAARAALIRDQAALDQVRLLIAAHRARLKLADPVLLGKLERVVAQVGELEAAAGERP
jgi:hypothetical protein